MASRVNTKFLLILFIVGASAVGLIGGLWVLKTRTDVTRSLRQADEYMAAGDYRRARTYYSRALSREPGNLQYLGKVEEALLAIQPETADEARELFAGYVSVLRHAADHRPKEAAHHLRLLREVHEVARRSASWGYTELLAESAKSMLERVPASDPEYVKGKLYLGIARVSPWMHDRMPEEEIEQGERDIEEALAAFPDSDIGWAALITARLAAARRFSDAGQQSRTDDELKELEETIAQARASVTDGPAILWAALQVAGYEYETDKSRVDIEACRRDLEELVRVARDQDEPYVTTQAALALYRLYWIPDRSSPVEVLDEHLGRHPEAHDIRLLRATLEYYEGNLESAEAAAGEIIDAGLMTVGYLSQLQFELKKRAQSLLVDVAVRRWDLAGSEEADAFIPAIEAAKDELARMVTDTENDPLLMRARGQLAFTKGEYAPAAALFSRLVAEGSGVDFRTRIYAALSLEELGELGAAVKLVAEAREELPGNTALLIHEAQLRGRMGQYEEADGLVDKILEIEPGNQDARILRVEIARRLDREVAPDADPLQQVLANASAAFRNAEYDAARSTLLAAHEQAPRNLNIINALVRIEIAAGRAEEARKYIDRALELAPKNPAFLTYRANLDNPDRIDAIKQFMSELYDDEVSRTVESLLAFSALRLRSEQRAEAAEREGRADAAAEDRAVEERARREIDALVAKAREIAPEHPRFIEFRFIRAAVNEEWDEVEEIIRIVERLDLDQAGGALYRGRYEVARNDAEAAARSFRQAVDRIPYSATAWRLLAIAYQQLGNYPEALNAFGKSYENNPNDVTTAMEYAKLLRRTGNVTRALIVIRQGRRLAANNDEMRELWLTLEGEGGARDVELRERRRRYAEQPEDRRNAAALARLLGETAPVRELLLDEDGTERFTFERWGRMTALGRGSQQEVLAEEQRKWYAEADAIVEGLAPPEERELSWHELRAELLRARGEIDAGEELLRGFAARQPESEARLQPLLALGFYEAKIERNVNALATYEQALQYQGEDDYRADLALADLLFRLGQFGAALPHLEAVLAKQPSRRIEMQAIECQVRLGRVEEARRRLDDLEARTAADATSTLLRASIAYTEASALWQRGEREAAETKYLEHRGVLAVAEQLDPSDPMPHVMRAAALYEAFKRSGEAVLLDDALLALAEADEVRADFDRTKMTRIQILRAKGNTSAAINELGRLLEQRPQNFEARQLLVQMLLAEERQDAAIETVQAAVDLNPTAIFWRVALADLFVIAQREAEAQLASIDSNTRAGRQLQSKIAAFKADIARHYEVAIEKSPSPELFVKRTEILLGNAPPDYEAAIQLLARHGTEVEASPALRALYARALASTGLEADREAALDHLKLAYAAYRKGIDEGTIPPRDISNWYGELHRIFMAQGPKDAEAFATEVCGGEPDAHELYALSQIWRVSGLGGVSRMMELLELGLTRVPPDDTELRSRLNADLAIAHLLMNQFDAALASLQKVLEDEPDNADVLNNIAYLMSEKFDQPKEALPYAERAKELQPSSGSVLDTLGWIHYRLGNRSEAESLLRQSSQLQPTAENQLHLAYVFCQSGRSDLASRYLSKAMELNPDPAIREEVDRLADDIRTGGCS